MRCHLSAGPLSCLLQIPATAQVPIQTDGQSIEGTFISQVVDSAGNLTLFEVGTFAPDGSYTGANVNGSHSTHKGVWVRTGCRKFVLTVLFFTRDAQGVFNGIVKAKIYLTLAEGLQSYDSVAERIVTDLSGKATVTYHIPGHAVRMNVEFPDYPPPQ